MHLWEVSEEQSFEMLWQYLHVLTTLQQGLVWMLLLQCSSALWAVNFQFWPQGNRRKRRKDVEEINGLSIIPSSSSSRWKDQRLMDTVKLLSAWNMMLSWGNWSRSATTLFSDTNTPMCAWTHLCVHMRQMNEENKSRRQLFSFPAFQWGKRKNNRQVEYKVSSSMLITSYCRIQDDISTKGKLPF